MSHFLKQLGSVFFFLANIIRTDIKMDLLQTILSSGLLHIWHSDLNWQSLWVDLK